MRYHTLAEWLAWQESLHPAPIELKLERVRAVAARMGLLAPPYRVVTVAGTNGKGSTVAMLEAIYRAAGYRVGAYFSPHLLRYNERVHIEGREADDAALCAAFDAVDRARGDISLTYFEFGTLAALDLFRAAQPDVVVLEVGLGGRLDAVNIIDADVAVITTIDLDHMEWLGPDREAIGREKAGILRPGRPAVCADPAPPASIAVYATEIGAPLHSLGIDFDAQITASGWQWTHRGAAPLALPPLPLAGRHQYRNAAAALMAVALLQPVLPVLREPLRAGLLDVRLAGRAQIIPGPVELVLDVAHNPQAAGVLADLLAARGSARTHAVLATLADKDTAGMVRALSRVVQRWYPAGTEGARGLAAAQVAARIRTALPEAPPAAIAAPTAVPEAALALARAHARPGERILVLGSFLTVARVLAQRL